MKKVLTLLMCLVVLGVMVSCSTKKNTGLTRRVQAFKARYNTYFNGHEAYKEGVQAQRTGNKDNYMEVIPLYMTGNPKTAALGKGNFDRTVEKCQKTIKQHSITARPEWKSSKPKTPKDKIWLSQKEYNPFLWKAWFLMGEAQFRKGEYMEAASTFAYIQRLYFSKPDLIARARLSEAKCYAELDWIYDAERLVNETRRDSFPKNLEALRASVTADYQLRQKQYEEAIPNIKFAMKKSKGVEKARLHFLLGQLYKEIGQNQLAFKEFKKVYKSNPPYELEFNARIQQTEVMSKGQSKKMISRLKAMARNRKNLDYLDQVYYAMGNIYLAQGDSLRAIYAYKDGVEKSTRNGVEKGVVWLHLGQLYWEKEEFVKAQECYAGVLGLFDKERDDYKEIDERAKILEELKPFAQAVELQDSLQELARMDSTEMLKKIDGIIEELKKKEREEERKQMEATGGGAQNNRPNQPQTAQNQMGAGNQQGGLWYFYNPASVSAGKNEFKRKWGERELADDWRRSNKTVLSSFDDEVAEGDSLMNDSVMTDSLANDSTMLNPDGTELSEEEKERLEKLKEYEADPHRREYYIKDIPYTEEQMATSNAALVDGLYNSAVIYKDRMENFPLAERTFQRILVDFEDFEHLDELYYNMFQLYSRQGRGEDAEDYRQKLIEGFPDNEHGKMIADPNFEFKGRYGKQIEDSLYTAAYDAYEEGNFDHVIATNEYAEKEYPKGDNRARFLFIDAMSKLEKGDRGQFMNAMKNIVQTYPQSTVSELAGLYVKGLQEGRILASGRMSSGSIWSRRMGMALADSTNADTVFKVDKNVNHMFVIAYEHDSINENQLIFEVARYNFSNFAIRYFDMETVRGDGIDLLQVKSFVNYDEAYVYMHKLLNYKDMAKKLEGLKMFIISEDNMKVLMNGKSFEEYFDFYDRNFNRIAHLQLDENILDEPKDLPTQEELEDMQMQEQKEEEIEDEENFIF